MWVTVFLYANAMGGKKCCNMATELTKSQTPI